MFRPIWLESARPVRNVEPRSPPHPTSQRRWSSRLRSGAREAPRSRPLRDGLVSKAVRRRCWSLPSAEGSLPRVRFPLRHPPRFRTHRLPPRPHLLRWGIASIVLLLPQSLKRRLRPSRQLSRPRRSRSQRTRRPPSPIFPLRPPSLLHRSRSRSRWSRMNARPLPHC